MPLDLLPDETLCVILKYIPPRDILASVSLVNRHLRRVSEEPLIWQYHCQTQFKHWADSNPAKDSVFQSGRKVPWKDVFEGRLRQRRDGSRIFNCIIRERRRRLVNYEAICRLDLDIKDYLLEELDSDEALPDTLARKYHARNLLDSIYRHKAVKEWYSVWLSVRHPERYASEYPDRPVTPHRIMERVLAAFDLFIGGEENSDIDSTLAILDDLACQFKSEHPSLHESTPRQQAHLLSAWVREQNLVGISGTSFFRNLRNCFIGQALRSENHDSLPIVSVAIFCSLADRIGLRADLVNFPNQVLAVVQPQDRTLDGVPFSELSAEDRAQHEGIEGNLYMPLWETDEDIPCEMLAGFLRQAGFQGPMSVHLGPANPLEVLARMFHNLRAAISDLSRHDLMGQHATSDMMAAECASRWAQLFTELSHPDQWNPGLLGPLSNVFLLGHPEDMHMLRDYVWKEMDSYGFRRDANTFYVVEPYPNFRTLCDKVVAEDQQAVKSSRRPPPGRDPVPYRIGQVFAHTRYYPQMVVVGWEQRGMDPEEAMSAADQLEHQGASHIVFYKCISSHDWVEHTVTPSSLRLVTDPDEVRVADFPRAGKYFKRFDREKCKFISNMEEQYPDD